jgi:phosphoglycolate phosphatase-like HAD superfamily hydrolase
MWLTTAGERFGHGKANDPALVQELAVRRNQLFDLICEKEREAADQVRTAAVFQEAAGSLVASTNARAEALRKQVETLRERKSPPVAEVPVVLEWLKARGEVITAVMNWHQARVKLQAAQGK